jgi:hypothetical protein
MRNSPDLALAPCASFSVGLLTMKAILGLALFVVLAGAAVYFVIKNPLLFDYISLFSSQANAQLEKSTWENDIEIRNGWPDAGVRTKMDVTNIGKRGMILVAVTLSCSEGEWGREQKILFDEGERRSVEFFFHEPTINATNIQTRTRLIPRRSE